MTDVQRSQLGSDAATTFDEFALTNASYVHALDLLKERYRQRHMITDATMHLCLKC